MALISSTSLDSDKYLFDFMPATRDTIFGFFTTAHISAYAFMASFGLTPKKIIDFVSIVLRLVFFAPSFLVFLEFILFLSINKIDGNSDLMKINKLSLPKNYFD